MLAKSTVLCLAAGMTAAFAVRIPMAHNYGTGVAAEFVHHVGDQRFLVTDITKPHAMAGFQANFFSNACDDGLLGQVTGSGGATCVQSWPGTKAIALLSQPAGCQVTIYTDENCSDNAEFLSVGQCLQETEVGIPSYSIDGNC